MAYSNVEDRKAYHRKWYAENKGKRVEQIVAYQQRVKQKIAAYKLEKGCEVCGYRKCARALEFHHREINSKEFSVSDVRKYGKSWERISAEIEKCSVLCANCHREVHDAEEDLPM